jgi:hypothetical protein
MRPLFFAMCVLLVGCLPGGSPTTKVKDVVVEKKETAKKVYSRDELKKEVLAATPSEVRAKFGAPDFVETADNVLTIENGKPIYYLHDPNNQGYWRYDKLVEESGKSIPAYLFIVNDRISKVLY